MMILVMKYSAFLYHKESDWHMLMILLVRNCVVTVTSVLVLLYAMATNMPVYLHKHYVYLNKNTTKNIKIFKQHKYDNKVIFKINSSCQEMYCQSVVIKTMSLLSEHS